PPGIGVLWHVLNQELLRRSRLDDDLVNALDSPEPATRAAAARICGAARLTESIVWIADLLQDPGPAVRDAAVRSLSRLGGRRAVEQLLAAADAIPLYRLALALSRAASDVDIEALMRQPASERAAIATVPGRGFRPVRLPVVPSHGRG